MIALILFLQIEWQTINRPYTDTEQELIIVFSLPADRLKYVSEDTLFFAEYESQIIVYSKAGKQIIGDYWERKIKRDTVDIKDSVKIVIPKESSYFELKLLDKHAGNIALITEKVQRINYIGNIEWTVANDTLRLRFSIINPDGIVDNMVSQISGMKQSLQLARGRYEDSLFFTVAALPNDTYSLLMELYSKTIKIDEVVVPVRVARPFYLDEASWLIKVSQLEYIATPSELKILRGSDKAARDSLWRTFWKQFDPTPNTEFNEREIEYFDRVAYTEKHFSGGDKGWRSDRGRIYITYGPPDEVQTLPYALYGPSPTRSDPHAPFYDAYEIWYYYRLNRRYVFGDRYGLGEFILINPTGL